VVGLTGEESPVETQQIRLVDADSGHEILRFDVVGEFDGMLVVDRETVRANEYSDVSRSLFGGDLFDE